MSNINSKDRFHLLNDIDSGFETELNSSSSLSSFSSSNKLETKLSPSSSPTIVLKRRSDAIPLIKFQSDGFIERLRPVTMKNSQNGDFVLCQTNRGAYIAHRTSAVPEWVIRLVEEIERQQR